MKFKEVMENIENGEGVTLLKKEFSKMVEEMDNDEFLKMFTLLESFTELAEQYDEFDDCDCDDCDCDDCDCEDCDCEDCDCEDCDCED